MNTFQTAWLKFTTIAHKEGYTRKVVGDYSFRKPQRIQGKFYFIQLKKITRDGVMEIIRSEQ